MRTETCSTVWHDITVLCWTAYFSLFIDRAQLRALSSWQWSSGFHTRSRDVWPAVQLSASQEWLYYLEFAATFTIAEAMSGTRETWGMFIPHWDVKARHIKKSNNPNEKPAGDWAIYCCRSNHCTGTHKKNGFTLCDPHINLPRLSSFASI